MAIPFIGVNYIGNKSPNQPLEEEPAQIRETNISYPWKTKEELEIRERLLEVDEEPYDFEDFDSLREEENQIVETMELLTVASSLSSITHSIDMDREKVVLEGKKFLGVPYVWGGTHPIYGLDCSGFTQLVYKNLGYTLPRVSKDQSRVGQIVIGSELKVGDLLFFDTISNNGANITVKNVDLANYFESNNYRPKEVSHVGIYIGNRQMIHAASGDGIVTISNLDENYYMKRFLHARRIITEEGVL